MTVFLLEGLPRAIARRGGNPAAFRAAVVGILLGVVGWHLYATHTWHRLRTVRIGQGEDAFLADARGVVLNEVLARLETLAGPGETLAVIPEGVVLNYLARMVNPTPYINFMPPEFIMFSEDRMIEAFEADPPDWIVLTDRHVPEYGYDLIGTDYGLKLMFWVQDHYEFADKVVDEQARREQLRYAAILRRADVVQPASSRAGSR
jgi:hypothetical protein